MEGKIVLDLPDNVNQRYSLVVGLIALHAAPPGGQKCLAQKK